MKTMLLIFIVTLIGVKLLSCSKIFPDDSFVLKKTTNNKNSLRLDGYYYQRWERDKIYSVNVFYRNGINLFLGDNTTINELESNLKDKIWLKNVSQHKTWWGLYEIIGNEMKFERYYPNSGGPLPAYIRSGKILNDTTFIITQSMRSNGSEISVKNETYHFRQFSQKPDSTNNFIK